VSPVRSIELNKNKMLQYLDEILLIEKDTSEKLGEDVYGSPWTAKEFLYEVPGKWRYSSLALIQDMPVGFLIMSTWGNNLHGHRMGIDIHRTGRIKVRIAQALYCRTAKRGREDEIDYFSAIVPKANVSTQRWYKHEGFEQLNQKNLKWFIEGRNFPGFISGDCVVDKEKIPGEPDTSYVFKGEIKKLFL
jgi:ribosomal protein S18 acetylase RimI-like enzyme